MARTNKYTQRRKGIVTPYGQWKYPGQVTTIPDNMITMKGVPYPVLGVSDKGDAKMMLPGMDYLFKGNEVTEYPVYQEGGNSVPQTPVIEDEFIEAPVFKYIPSQEVIDKMKEFEGFRSRTYWDNIGKKWTVGYGFTNPSLTTKYRTSDMSREEGDKYFMDEVNKRINGFLQSTPNYEMLNQNQLDALFDLYWNVGQGTYTDKSPSMQKALKNMQWDEVVKQMDHGMKQAEGLRRRRLWDQELFVRPIEKQVSESIDNSIGVPDITTTLQTGGNIHINPKNRGKFTAAAQRAGKSVQAYAAQILANKENYSPTLVKRANFARNSASWKHQTGKYAKGGTPPHWDPDHPHFHMDAEGNIFPADYEGDDNAYYLEEEIPNVTPLQIINAIKEHTKAMDDDKYKYIDNPEYQKILPTLKTAKKIYDWGNAKMNIWPYKTNWEFMYPKMPLSFDENGVGYLNGQTYLPMNRSLKDGEKTYSIVGPSDISNSQYYEYVPTDVPSEKIVRTEFPEIPVISNETQIAAKQKAIDKYIANNTRQKRIVSGYNEASSVPYYELDETIYPDITYYEDNVKEENSFVSKLIRSTIDKRKKEWGTDLYYPKGFLSDKKYINYPYEDKRYSAQPIHSHKKFYGVMKNGEYQFPYLEDPSRYIYENTIGDYVNFLNNYNDKEYFGKHESITQSESPKLLLNKLNDWFGTYSNKIDGTPWRIERKAEYHPANTSRTPIYKTIIVKPSQEEAERNAQIDLRDLLSKHQKGGDKPSFEEYYQSLPAYKNDTTNYDLRTAYQFLPYEEMKQFATMPEKHLSSVVELPDGSYRFLKSKNHPSLQQEIDWYNSDEAKEFRNNYTLDKSGEYYRYVPKKHQIGKYQSKGILDKAKEAWRSFKAGFTRDSDVRTEPLHRYNSDDYKRDLGEMVFPIKQYKDEHPWFNPVYNSVNLGLYAAAPFTDGATLPLAYAMSTTDAAIGVADAYANGLNIDNGLSIAGGVPIFKMPKTFSFGIKLKPQTISLLQPYSYSGNTNKIKSLLNSHNVPDVTNLFRQYYLRKEAANLGLRGADDLIEIGYDLKHQDGGDMELKNNVNAAKKQIGKYLEGNYVQPNTVGSVMGAWNDQLAKGIAKGDNIANLVGTGLQAAATASGAVATQFGKDFTKDIMAGQQNKQTSAIASNFEVQENPNAAPLYWPSEQNNNIQPLNNGYYGFPVIDNGGSPYKSNQKVDADTIGYNTWLRQKKEREERGEMSFLYNMNMIFPETIGQNEDQIPYYGQRKLATGGSSSTPAEIERGEIVSTPTGDSIANGLMNYHELYSNDNEQTGNIVNLTNNMQKDVVRNPQLSPVSKRVNRYTSMRRNGNTFIFPSTVGLNGRILEPKKGINYPLAELINNR